MTAVVLGGRSAAAPVLRYAVHGRAFRSVRMTPTGNGTYRAVIPGRFATFRGVDYAIVAGGVSDLAGYPGPLYHGVGIAIG